MCVCVRVRLIACVCLNVKNKRACVGGGGGVRARARACVISNLRNTTRNDIHTSPPIPLHVTFEAADSCLAASNADQVPA